MFPSVVHNRKDFVMRRHISLALSVVFSLCILLAGFSSSAHAATSNHHMLPGCAHTELTLHGHNKPSTRCLDANIGAQPNIFSRKCGSDQNDLTIYWNSPLNPPNQIPGGPILCIRGKGYLDLSQGVQADGHNWNDQASAWWAGCSSGHFDENAGIFRGTSQNFNGGAGTSAPHGNFNGQNGALNNDSLTVVTLDSDC